MVTLEVTEEQGYALISCINYLFAGLQDIEKIESQEGKDKAELDLRRAIDQMSNIPDENMQSMFDLLRVLHEKLWGKVSDVDMPEMVDDNQPDIA